MKPTIVFVDDDAHIRDSIKRSLRGKSYRVLALESAQQCIDVLAVTNIDVLISDLSMPGINGKTLIKYFKHNVPSTIRIVLSGNLNLETTLELINSGEVFRCLEKPCPAATLHVTIKDALQKFGDALPKTSSVLNRQCDNHSSHSDLTSLVLDALNDVERLGNALDRHSEQESPIDIGEPHGKQ